MGTGIPTIRTAEPGGTVRLESTDRAAAGDAPPIGKADSILHTDVAVRPQPEFYLPKADSSPGGLRLLPLHAEPLVAAAQLMACETYLKKLDAHVERIAAKPPHERTEADAQVAAHTTQMHLDVVDARKALAAKIRTARKNVSAAPPRMI